MWVFKTTAFEPQSQRSKRKKDLSLSAGENVQKLFKSVQPIILVDFSFQQTQIFFPFAAL